MTTSSSATIVDLPNAHDPALYGAKAATLAALHAAGISVPSGAVLPTTTGDRHLTQATVRLCHWAAGAGHEVLVVRSSSPSEDGADTSFAGIYQSCFTPATPDGIRGALTRVLGSLRASVTRAYTRARAADDEATMAVLVQPARGAALV
ncbi:MAG: PEP/pyruvate-binding domain-containing protein [Pseudonocardiaceae bacterium]